MENENEVEVEAAGKKPKVWGQNVKNSTTCKNLTYTHEAMIDLILQEPTVTPAELATLFGHSKSWISCILSADSFRARLAERKGKLLDPYIAQSLNERMKSVAIRAIDIVEEKLSSERSASYAIDALGLAATSMNAMRKVGGK